MLQKKRNTQEERTKIKYEHAFLIRPPENKMSPNGGVNTCVNLIDPYEWS